MSIAISVSAILYSLCLCIPKEWLNPNFEGLRVPAVEHELSNEIVPTIRVTGLVEAELVMHLVSCMSNVTEWR